MAPTPWHGMNDSHNSWNSSWNFVPWLVRTLVGAQNLLNTLYKNACDTISLPQFAMAPIPTIWKYIQSQSKHIGYVKTLDPMGWQNPNSITLKEN